MQIIILSNIHVNLIWIKDMTLRCGLDRDYSIYVLGGMCFSPFFFFLYTRFSWVTEVTVHTVRLLFTHCFILFTYFLATFSLKMGPTVLFTHLKIVLLQCFQFSAKISCIQTDLKPSKTPLGTRMQWGPLLPALVTSSNHSFLYSIHSLFMFSLPSLRILSHL